MWRFLFFIIFILLIQGLFKLLEKGEKEEELEEKPTTEEELKKYFEALGLPVRVPTSKKEKIPKKKEEIEEVKPSIIRPSAVEEKRPIPTPKIKTEEEILTYFPSEKLEEGIILSEILGPPKSLKILSRGVGTGRRSGLKNRWLQKP